MSDEHLRELADYRLHQARESLQEAAGLSQMSFWRGTINRAYYAMFYAVLALLQEKEMGTSKHAGAISLFDREFMRKT